jgi:hypothetical protein
MLNPVKLQRLTGIEEFCQAFQSKMQTQLRPYISGRNLQRWRGQSLEFRDYAPYVRGDDIRYVDWRASIRTGKANEWVMRRFQAEEEFNLILSIDTRESMCSPGEFPKVQAAAWGAETAAQIALRSGDKVYLHRLFGPPHPPIALYHKAAIPRIFPTLQKFAQTPVDESPRRDWLPELNLSALQGRFFINSALVIFSDFYFLNEPVLYNRMKSFIQSAQQGWRWVILVNLDSWPFEKYRLQAGREDAFRRIWGPGLNGYQECDGGSEILQQVEEKIYGRQATFLKSIGHNDAQFDLHWRWPVHLAPPAKKQTGPGPAISAEHFFKDSFAAMSSGTNSRPNPFCQLFIRQR